MALPSRGQRDWDDDLNNEIQRLDAAVQSAVADASVAKSGAAYSAADAQRAREAAELAASTAVAPSAEALASVDADPSSAFRVQQDARLNATYADRALVDSGRLSEAALNATYADRALVDSGRLSEAALNATYASKATETTVETGRLSEAGLDVAVAARSSMNLLTAAAMSSIGGSPTIASVGSAAHLAAAAWSLPGDSYSVVGGILDIPDSWGSFHIDLWWTQAVTPTPSGNPLVSILYGGLTHGSSLNTLSEAADAGGGLSVPPQHVVYQARMTGSTPVSLSGADVVNVRVSRDGAGDTLSSPIYILAVQFVPA